MTVGPHTRAVVNVALGWLGMEIPPIPKHRRRPYRKTDQRRGGAAQLIRRLQREGCQPRQVGDGEWVAMCPTCKLAGRHSWAEIRIGADGSPIIACVGGHEGVRPS